MTGLNLILPVWQVRFDNSIKACVSAAQTCQALARNDSVGHWFHRHIQRKHKFGLVEHEDYLRAATNGYPVLLASGAQYVIPVVRVRIDYLVTLDKMLAPVQASWSPHAYAVGQYLIEQIERFATIPEVPVQPVAEPIAEPAPEPDTEPVAAPGITLYEHPEFGRVRVVMLAGEPWFVARDVAVALGYSNPPKAVTDHCKKAIVANAQSMGVNESFTPENSGFPAGLDPKTKFIPESDLYRLVMRSKLESAERFQDWVVEEVLPQIRKTGTYQPTTTTSIDRPKPGTVFHQLEDIMSRHYVVYDEHGRKHHLKLLVE